MAEIFGAKREAAIARELTKQFETVRAGTLAELVAWMGRHEEQQRGEFVVLVHGVPRAAESSEDSAEAERVLHILLEVLPVSQAAEAAARITGAPKNRLYRHALTLRTDKTRA